MTDKTLLVTMYKIQYYTCPPSAVELRKCEDNHDSACCLRLVCTCDHVPESQVTSWRSYGSVVHIREGVHSITMCALKGNTHFDYIRVRHAEQYAA